MLEQRYIEAMILKHVYDALKATHGIEVAQRTVADAVRASSIEQAKEFAAKVGGKTSIQTFVDRQSLRERGARDVPQRASRPLATWAGAVGIRPPVSAKPIARTGPPAPGAVGRIGKLAAVYRQASAADAFG